MEYGILIGVLHQWVGYLLYPVIVGLMLATAICFMEIGLAFTEALYSLKRFSRSSSESPELLTQFEQYASLRLERVDLLSRAGPILGLMGTLIPLGPGLTALGNGQIDMLATALSVAFDTTVVGLLVGLIAFTIAKIRRRWYDNTWRAISQKLENADGL